MTDAVSLRTWTSRCRPSFILPLTRERRCRRENRSLTVKVSGSPFALKVISHIVFLIGAFANARHVIILIDVSGNSDPGFPGGRSVCARIEPTILYAGDHRKCEQGRARPLGLCSPVVDKLRRH